MGTHGKEWHKSARCARRSSSGRFQSFLHHFRQPLQSLVTEQYLQVPVFQRFEGWRATCGSILTPFESMKRFLILTTACLATAPLPAFSQVSRDAETQDGSARVYDHWTTFLHPGSGYELPVPPRVRAIGVPETSPEARFVSPDGAFELRVWGGLSRRSPLPHFEAEWRLARNKPGRTVNYQRKAGSWFVVSGTDQDGIEFYEKFTMRGNHVGGFAMTYPRSRLWEFEPWVVAVEKGFRLVAPTAGRRLSPSRGAAADRQLDAGTTDIPDTRSAPGGSRSLPRSEMDSEAMSRRTADAAPERVTGRSANLEDKSPDPEKLPSPSMSAKSLPVGKKVPGKPGFVYSPFSADQRLVDVDGIPSGTQVKCPYTMKIFRVP